MGGVVGGSRSLIANSLPAEMDWTTTKRTKGS